MPQITDFPPKPDLQRRGARKASVRARSQSLPLGEIDPFRPSSARPVRIRSRQLAADLHFEPHSHPWGQLAYCASGVLQMTLHAGASVPTELDRSLLAPPSRAVWIAPGELHSAHVLETADLRTLYIHTPALAAMQPSLASGVLAVSPLLRELIDALESSSGEREQHLSALIADEIARSLATANPHSLVIRMPSTQADRRLRALCEAVIAAPQLHTHLRDWAGSVGASERTAQRLFTQSLGMGFQVWRNQVLVAHAMPLLAQGMAVGQVAAKLGYARASAFSAMYKAVAGHSPKSLKARA